jgi:hypothetical protein
MRRLAVLLSLVTLACVFFAVAWAPRGASGEGKKYIIHLKDGGKLKTDNYTVERGMVKIMLPAGAISLDKSMIKSIEEVQGEEGTTMQKVFVPTPAPPEGEKKTGPTVRGPKEKPSQPTEPMDDLGHTQAWWKERVAQWKKRLEDAEKRYRDAKKDWDNYNGILTGIQSSQVTQRSVQNVLGVQSTFQGKKIQPRQVVLGVVTTTFTTSAASPYEVTKYEDLRGSARTKMDAASADMAEAKQMLDETLPDEARRAGAPIGWVRY